MKKSSLIKPLKNNLQYVSWLKVMKKYGNSKAQ
jgi:hypothetical protein